MDDLNKELARWHLSGHHKTFIVRKVLLLQCEWLPWQQHHWNEDQKNFISGYFKILYVEKPYSAFLPFDEYW